MTNVFLRKIIVHFTQAIITLFRFKKLRYRNGVHGQRRWGVLWHILSNPNAPDSVSNN